MAQIARILVINDDPIDRERIVRYVAGQGTIDAPAKHKDLLGYFLPTPTSFALVILDYYFTLWTPTTPPLNGAEALKILRPAGQDLPYVMLLTKYPDRPEVKQLEKEYNVVADDLSRVGPDKVRRSAEVLIARWSKSVTPPSS